MKRTLLAILLFAIATVATSTQAPKEQAPPTGGTRVAVVNFVAVIDNYQGSKQSAGSWRGMEEVESIKHAGKKHINDLATWEKAIRDRDFSIDSENGLNAKIASAKKQLNALDAKIQQALERRQEEYLVRHWKAIQAAVKTCATAHDIDIVLSYADPREQTKRDEFSNVNRKMQAMELGGIVPLHVSPHADITNGVTALLNRGEPEKGAKKPARLGTDRVAVVNIPRVLLQYKTAIKFKDDLWAMLTPYKRKGERIRDDIRTWERAIANRELDNDGKESIREKIRAARNRLEDMSTEIQRVLGGKKQEETLVLLWRDVQDGIKSYAGENGIELVLGYGDPMRNELRSVNGQRQTVDLGGTVPLSALTKTDISAAVLEYLHKRRQEKKD